MSDVIEIHEGSAKNMLLTKFPTPEVPGEGLMEFLDSISVFDYGRMIDLEWKGIMQTLVAKKTFELLEDAGIKTHYMGPGDNPNELKVQIVNVPEAQGGTGWYRREGIRNIIIPVEIIARDNTHPESSDLKKIHKKGLTYDELGYSEMPVPHKKLPGTKIAYSTKFEPKDRVITTEQAAFLAGLPLHVADDQITMDSLENFTRTVFDTITGHTEKTGFLNHYDGKIEVAVDSEGNLMLVDVAGTLDEHRFMAKVDADIARNYLDEYREKYGIDARVFEDITSVLDSGKTHLEAIGEDVDGFFVDSSKQFLRNIYKDTLWKKEIDELEDRGNKEGKNWREDYTVPEPPVLNENTKRVASDIYIAHTMLYCGEEYVRKHTKGMDIPLRDANEVFAEAWVMERLRERGAYKSFVDN